MGTESMDTGAYTNAIKLNEAEVSRCESACAANTYRYTYACMCVDIDVIGAK